MRAYLWSMLAYLQQDTLLYQSVCTLNHEWRPEGKIYRNAQVSSALVGSITNLSHGLRLQAVFQDNVQFTKVLAQAAHAKQLMVEAELGSRLSAPKMLVSQAEELPVSKQKVDALAVCVLEMSMGNYPAVDLNLDLLKDLNVVAERHNAVLVLHGASGVPEEYVKACIERGVAKFNVNTEMRGAYMETLRSEQKDLVDFMSSSKQAMEKVVTEKLRLFGSSGKAI
ncbi:hypothetical protein R1flu_011807 [Riccia fluitans]|uniref:Fructose-bisphosphate aldolase n=1 Tax=Riccia fluitans TaxID=41844 RepID=A0ABD1Z8T4_9MARC